jgi:arylsulfatase A-like enzyme
MARLSLTRRVFLAAGAAVCASPFLTQHAARAAAPPPNIVWIFADDVGPTTFGCYGNPAVRTPHLDRLAAEGLRFTRAFVTSPSCSPSRASLFTGMYAHSIGAEDLHDPVPAGVPMAHELLKAAGYYTGSVGKIHLGKEAEKHFEVIYKREPQWRDFIDARPKGKPFFLHLGFHDAHRPFDRGAVEPPHEAANVVVPPYLPDTPETREDLAAFYDEISRMDEVIGGLIARLEEEGILDNTFIAFCGDNGMPFPRAKNSLYDPGIASPCIMRWPGRVPAGELHHGLTSLVDWTPTTLEVAGLPVPGVMYGRSLLPAIQQRDSVGRPYVFAARNWHDFDDHSRCVRDGRYKLIRNAFPERPLNPAADLIRSPTFQKMRELRDAGTLTPEAASIFAPKRAPIELYDLAHDAGEFHNVAENPAYAPVVARMTAALDAWVSETNDVPPSKSKPDLYDPETGERL